jgi:restriction enzyme bgcI subunit beta
MSKKLKLTDREWKEFVFGDVFDIQATSSGIDKKKLFGGVGNVPYLTRTDNNNGIDGFVELQEASSLDEGNVITIGLDTQTVFYQESSFYTGQNIQVVKHKKLNKYNALFIIRAIRILVQKFSWGSYGATLTRLRRGKLFLPILSDGAPDWEFMSNYMKQVEDELLSEVRPKLEAQLLEHIINLGALEDREWRKFKIGNLFSVRIGKSLDGNKVNRVGQVAYITRKESDNGLDGFIDEDDFMLTDVYPVITIGNETAQPFVQVYPFFTGTKVNILIPKESIARDLYTLQFIAVSLAQHKGKYSYSYTINSSRLKEQVVLLPVQSDGTPDWEFMSAFMQRVEQETLGKTLQFFKLRCEEMQNRGGGKMQPYFIEDVLFIANGVRLTKADMQEGCRPFVGASEASNGVTTFIENSNASLDSNVLGVNYNGSVGFSFYHPYEALFSDDVKRVRWKDETANNKYTLLYLSTAIAQQRRKYAYGYKFNSQRMKRQIIMLPSLPNGTPDYAYMEHTMRVMEYDVLKNYLMSK